MRPSSCERARITSAIVSRAAVMSLSAPAAAVAAAAAAVDERFLGVLRNAAAVAAQSDESHQRRARGARRRRRQQKQQQQRRGAFCSASSLVSRSRNLRLVSSFSPPAPALVGAAAHQVRARFLFSRLLSGRARACARCTHVSAALTRAQAAASRAARRCAYKQTREIALAVSVGWLQSKLR